MTPKEDISMSVEDDALPHTAYELIDLLDKAYPARCISATDTMAQAQRYAGARDLIDGLISMREEDNERQRERQRAASTA